MSENDADEQVWALIHNLTIAIAAFDLLRTEVELTAGQVELWNLAAEALSRSAELAADPDHLRS